ncbi:hypothetical protein JCM10207_005658 [Rhodosporidiobolus poonsookiae]
MLLAVELLAQVARALADSAPSPAERRRLLLQLSTISQAFRVFARDELFRRPYIDDAHSLAWLQRELDDDSTAGWRVQDVSILFSAGPGMVDRAQVTHLLASLPRLRSLGLKYAPTRFAWERLAVEGMLEKVDFSYLRHLTLTNIDLRFTDRLPVFPSLLSLMLTESHFSASPPSRARAHLPLTSFPSLAHLALLDAPNIDYRRLPYSRAPLHSPTRHLLPLLPQLWTLTLDVLMLQRFPRPNAVEYLRLGGAAAVEAFVEVAAEVLGSAGAEGGRLRILGVQLEAVEDGTRGELLGRVEAMGRRWGFSVSEVGAGGTAEA